MQAETNLWALLSEIFLIIHYMFHNTTRKQIILVRHAKVLENEEYTLRDFDRPLSAEGERANYIVANYLRLIGIKPDRIVTSPAVRAKATALGIAKKFHITGVEESPLLYVGNPIAGRDAMAVHMDVVRKSKKDCNILMIVGHNNDLTDFAMYLSGESLPSMKKWSVMVLSLPEGADWKTVTPGSLKFIYYLTPQFLKLEELV